MLDKNSKKITVFHPFNEQELWNDTYIVVLHATRIPPHIGLIIDKEYHSLTIKGHDTRIQIKALVKNIKQRKSPSLFIKIKPHNTFSEAFLKEHFILNIRQFPRVDNTVATCLSPIKCFFEEVYDVSMNSVNFLFDLLPRLQSANLALSCSALFVDEATYSLPVYTASELEKEIEKVRTESKHFHAGPSKPIPFKN